MRAVALAGRFSPRGGASTDDVRGLEAALSRDGPAVSAGAGALAVAWTGAAGLSEPGPRGALCVVDGRPLTAALAAELRCDPATPAEVLVAAAWPRLGERLLELLDGEFALVVWDAKRGRGLLARDRLGSRPLFLSEAGGALLFASEVRNLLPLLPARPAPDTVALANWLGRTPPGSRTLYRGIERLPSAHAVVLGENGWSMRAYWRPRHRPPRQLTPADAASEVRAALGRAVERALAGARTPAVMLSGGLDSAAVAAEAQTRAPVAYSVVFPEDGAVDESARIAATRDRLGLDWVEATFRGGGALLPAIEFQREWELPSATPNLFIWLPLLRQAAADGIDVLLDGEGGDELFGCARYLVADRLRAGRPLAALATARRLPGMGARPRLRWLWRALVGYGARGGLPFALHQRARRLRARRRMPAWLSDEAMHMQRATDQTWSWKRTPGPRWWAQLAAQLTGEALGAADQFRRESRLAGVELRHPLRDPELVELMLGVAPELSFDPHLDRPLLRRALEGELPRQVLAHTDKPAFNSLLEAAFHGPDSPALRRLLAAPHPELARLVRRQAVESLVEHPTAAERPRAWALDMWRLVSIELWLRGQAGDDVEAAVERERPAVSFRRRAP